jgi:uncharacterized DUF497 family protein
MEDALIDWDEHNVAEVAAHDVTPGEVESVIRSADAVRDISRATGRPMAFGYTKTGRFIGVVYEILNPDDPVIIRPVTAYEPDDPLA